LTFAGPVVIGFDMEPGTIVEYIDRKEMVCAVVLEDKKQRLRMLTEHNREVSHGENRLAHTGGEVLDLRMGRDALVERLQAMAKIRSKIQDQIDIQELWEVVHTEAAWIDLKSMAELCFGGEVSSDHTSAVVRALFTDRLYFKFDTDRFFPNSPEQVARMAAQAAQEAKKTRIIAEGSRWVRQVMETENAPACADKEEIVEILRSFYLFRKNSAHYKIGKEIIACSGLDPKEGPFHLLVKLGVWSKDENLNLHRFGVSHCFSSTVMRASERLIREATKPKLDAGRRDLTHLSVLTIDGQGTLDFDDAISVEPKGDGYRLGVHITDVSHFVEKGSLVDQEAFSRASSIYMPDDRIPMLPTTLAEDLCSLKEGQDRLAISIMADLDISANVAAYEIVPSIIRVKKQLTYYHANLLVQEVPELGVIYELAQKFRDTRLKNGALQLILPEINVWVDNDAEISVTQINRESPSRMMVSECMIMANWLAARFLRDHGQPAIYRSQPPPRERLIQEGSGTLYENWKQRRFLSRVVLDLDPRTHAGLGLDAYLTLTSPLRKYLDLVTQRQLRGLFGLERSYSEEELRFIIQALEEPMSYITVLQQERTRYWILRYLEDLVGHKEEALVLDKRRQRYTVLLPSYMIECSLPLNSGADLKPQDTIEVKIERVNARADTLTLSRA